jgi:hypothetical protein
MTDFAQAILAIKPDSDFHITNLSDINSIVWVDGNPSNITNSQIETKLAELQAEYAAQDYARKRKAAYPDIYDYMDGIVKDDQTQINKYIADCQAVKVRYKKG